MKNYSKAILISCVCIAVMCCLQCKKDTPVTAPGINAGFVKEYYTNKPIANAEVSVYEDVNYRRVKETVYTDSNGRFVTSENLYNNPLIFVGKQGYFNYTYYNENTNRDRINNIIWLDVPAYIRVHVRNVTQKYEQVDINGFPPDLIPPLGSLQLLGYNVDTVVCCISTVGYKIHTIPAFGYPGGIAVSVKCIPSGNQTTDVDIFY